MPSTQQAVVVTYSIGELAREFDLTTRAIRFYEDVGLIQPARQGANSRTRVYSARDRARLMLTLRAKRLGLSLTEARELLDMYDGPQDTAAQLQRLLELLAAHRGELEARMAELQTDIDEIRARERKARGQLAKAQRNTSTLET
ncbi:MerR family DNA-binding transcriptional regulator [Xylophilus sp. GOD-11R]|uniref:MerR family transcriptional regulator n=1 Tax=Xylophilus sp. GOD-11R TaxID=3089814 RepID=UPI00298C36E1|nr:MerR family DNA-binding transcriptional regulator [Xylophilus sp. GOD-11R]WPB58000.1 MerR family DNA-binding transcriptional regulator [Xylophilus sp. GOD-11R]